MTLTDVIDESLKILRKLPDSEKDCDKLEDYRAQLEHGQVNISLQGAFSSGKSSVINALIEYPLLPCADRALTSKRIEIRHSEKLFMLLHWDRSCSPDEQKLLMDVLAKLVPTFPWRKKRYHVEWGSDARTCRYAPLDLDKIARFLRIMEGIPHPEERLKPIGIRKLFRVFSWIARYRQTGRTGKKELLEQLFRKISPAPSGIDVDRLSRNLKMITIGMPMPEFCRNICWVDLPGAGSLDKYRDNTETAAQTAQIILHVLEADHVGDKLTRDLISGSDCPGIRIFLLNKKDRIHAEGLQKAMEMLGKDYHIENAVAVSALYENAAQDLHTGRISVTDLQGTNVNLAELTMSPTWKKKIEDNRPEVEKYLREQSGVALFRETLCDTVKNLYRLLEPSFGKLVKEILCRKAREIQKQRELLNAKIEENRSCLLELKSQQKKIDNVLIQTEKFREKLSSAVTDKLEDLSQRTCVLLLQDIDRCENDIISVFDEVFSSMPLWEINTCVRDVFNKLAKALSDCCSCRIPEFTWQEEKTFCAKVQNQCIEWMSRRLKDTSEKPGWLNKKIKKFFFGRDAMEEYFQKKRIECRILWERDIRPLFTAAAEQIIAENKPKLNEMRQSLRREKSKLEAKMTRLEEDGKKLAEQDAALNAVEKQITNLVEKIIQGRKL